MFNPLGQARAEVVSEALRLPIAEGPVVFIGAPWMLYGNEDTRRTSALHSGAVAHVTHGSHDGEGW